MRTPEVEEAMQRCKHHGVHYLHDDPSTLAAEVERLEADLAHAKRHAQCMSNAEHGLFAAIIFRLRPHFPAGSRDLEWDVLPGAVGALAQRAEAAEARVSWLEQQREEECKQKEAALKESGMCLKETREFKERAFKAEARVEELEVDYAKWYRRCASLVYALPGNVCAGELQKWEADYATGLARAEARVKDLEAQNARLRAAIQNCVDWSNGRESEWGERAENAFTFLHKALADGKAAPS